MAERTELPSGAGSLLSYESWIENSRPGDVLVYWTGDLQFDRQVNVVDIGPEADEARRVVTQLNAVANRVFEDNRYGRLALTQKRLGVGDYEYRATRTAVPLPRKGQPSRTKYGVPVYA